MVSAQEDAAVVVRSREFGASGFIPKSSTLETIQEAVRAILAGEVWWPPQAFEAVSVSAEAKAASEGLASLTPQQFRVLTMVCEGLLNKADCLRIECLGGHGKGPRHGDFSQAQRAHPDASGAVVTTAGMDLHQLTRLRFFYPPLVIFPPL